MWRKDLEVGRGFDKEERKELKEDRKELMGLIRDNAATNALLAASNKELKESVYHFSDVVKSCERR
jgi:hypothetical protein